MRVHILIGGHLSTAPRPQKEARALMDAGHDVEVSGVWSSEEKAAWDREMISRSGIAFTPALDFRGGTPWGKWRRLRARLRARGAREAFLRAGLFSPALLGYGAKELLRAALDRPADLAIVHSEAGLWVGRELLRRGRRVGIDFEDWFSRDLPPTARRTRPLLRLEEFERELAQNSRYVLAPSRAMAGALAHAYGISLPQVIYNSFPASDLDGLDKDRLDRNEPSLHWFSQTIGEDRGLQLLFDALPLLKNRTRLYLRGACSDSTRRWLEESIPSIVRANVTVLPPVPAHELPSRIAEHDIGFALETSSIPSRDLTASNKLFQYFQGGLAVIATDTRGQREVLASSGEAGILLSGETPALLARAIDSYLFDPERLARAQAAAFRAAENFSWERQRAGLVRTAEEALGGN